MDFISGNLNKGVANLLGAPVDAVTNALNLSMIVPGILQHKLGGGAPHEPIQAPVGGSEWIQNVMRNFKPGDANRPGMNFINQSAEPQSAGGRYLAGGLQMLPSMVAGRPTAAQIPKAASAAFTSGVTGEVARDIGGDEYAAVGAMLPGARGVQHKGPGERATTARQARDFAAAKELGIPVPPRELKADKPQQKIQNAANKDIRQPEGTEFTPQSLQNLRNTHWQDYQAIINEPALKGQIQATPKFRSAIQKIATDERQLRSEFPNSVKDVGLQQVLSDFTKPSFTTEGAMSQVQRLRESATNNISSASANDDTIRMGLMQRRIANALEDMIGENVERIGKPELAKKWQEARTQIAKTHDLQAALEPGGKINPKKLAALQNDGQPLSGQLKQLAQVSGAFPGAVQTKKESDEFFTKRVTPMAVTHPEAATAHWLTRMWDPLTTSAPAQKFLVDPASRLTPEQQQMLRYLAGATANQRGQIPTPP